MEHLTLTETEFFRLINNPESRSGLRAAYEEFIAKVVSLCHRPSHATLCMHCVMRKRNCNTTKPCSRESGWTN